MPVILFSSILITLVVAILAFRMAASRAVIVHEFQRGLRFHKGRLTEVLEPGRYWTSGSMTVTLLDMRLQTLIVANQEILTADGLALKISLAGDYRIEDPRAYVLVSASPAVTLHNLAQQALRDAMSTHSFDSLLTTRTEINARTLALLQPQALALGITLARMEIRDMILPGELKRAYTQVVTAQKEGLASLERARAESASLRTLANAARLMQEHPGLLQLRAVQAVEASKSGAITLAFENEPQTRKTGLQ